MLNIIGNLITVKNCMTKKDKPYKRLQLLCDGKADTIRVECVKDFKNRDYANKVGKEIKLEVFAFPWVGKSGTPGIDYVMV